jgi:DNA polymerase I
MQERLVVIDGNSLVHRAFYAMPPMSTEDGRPTNAIFGFMSMLLKILDDYKPQYLCVAFDKHGPTFRHDKYAEYKAGRKPMPEDMRPQLPMLRDLLDKMQIARVDADGFEADDFLGTLAKKAEAGGVQAVLITGDRDALQLVDEHTLVVLTKKGVTEIEEYTPQHLMDVYGLRPDQIPDLKGLMGDSSDNIPGIPGVGEKTALNLMHEYGGMEEILANAANIKGKMGEKVAAGAESARFSKELATIERDAPLDRDFRTMTLKPWQETGAFEALEDLELRAILGRLRAASGVVEQKAKLTAVKQVRLESVEEIGCVLSELVNKEGVAIYLNDNLSFSYGVEEYTVPIMRDLAGPGIPLEEALRAAKPLFESGVGKILHDGKAWITLLRPMSIAMNNIAFDTMIAGYLLNPLSGKYDFKDLCEKALGTAPEQAPASALLSLADKQKQSLVAQEMKWLYDIIELPLVRVLADMEAEGFRMDSAVLRALGAEFEGKLNELSARIYELAGMQFNINSTRQLGEVLFEKLGMPYGRKTKTGWSTDAEVLEQLSEQNEIVPAIMEYRQIAKLKSTYIDGLLPLVSGAGRVHTTLHQTVTSTGRISSSDPNLQNIPVRMDLGRPIRKAFVAGNSESVLVDGDYSQIELRVLAHIAGDERMLAAFHSGADFHRQTASQVFGVPPAEVTDQMRSSAKAVNFGIVYGISDFGLARQLGISRAKAKEYIDRYLTTYSGVKAYMENSVKNGRDNGYVATLFGRRRPMPELKSGIYTTRSFGERVAMNAPIQGTAADIIKLAMIKTHDELAKRGFKAKLILQVHDELIIDCPKDEAEAVMKLLDECMESVAQLQVPLKADVSQGYSWYDAK